MKRHELSLRRCHALVSQSERAIYLLLLDFSNGVRVIVMFEKKADSAASPCDQLFRSCLIDWAGCYEGQDVTPNSMQEALLPLFR